MSFTSITFLVFLILVFAGYWLMQKHLRWQNAFVLAASYIFYGWWDWRFLVLIVFTSVCSFVAGIEIEKFRQRGSVAKIVSLANVVLNLVILGFFKYFNFFVESLSHLVPGLGTDQLFVHVILPVGISFYTFQALSYSIDVYRQKISATHDIVQFCAYVSFFPQLVAGPIERATNLLPQFAKMKEFDYDMAVDGVRQMLWGFFKKLVVADNCALFVDEVWSNYSGETGSTLVVASIFFAFQIYGDFSGYSDIAIGTSKLFGIKLMKNFNYPYFSRDIAEFWRRWHISLNTWFRDYIYIPLGGSRVSRVKMVRNTFVIFLLSGLWHGANWTYVAWGAFHAALFLPLILLNKNRKHMDGVSSDRYFPSLREFGGMLLTFGLVVIGWVIFRAPSLVDARDFFSSAIGNGFFLMPSIPHKTMCFIVLLVAVEWIQRDREHGLSLERVNSHILKYSCYLTILGLIFCFGAFNETFIYFQF